MFNGLQAIDAAAALVAVHDSARPLVTKQGTCLGAACMRMRSERCRRCAARAARAAERDAREAH